MSWGLVAVAGATIGGSLLSSNAAGDAADTQAASAADTNALNKYIYDNNTALEQPLYQNGLNAQNKLAQLVTGGGLNTQFSYNPSDLASDPGYQFQLNQGNKAIQNSAAARGGLNSGATLKALDRYSQDYAGTAYNTAYNRAQSTFNSNLANTLNPLQSLAGQAQTSTSALASAGNTYANNVGSTNASLANATGASQIASANSLSNGLTGAANAYSSNNLLQQLLGGSSSAWKSAGSTNYGIDSSGGYTGGMSLTGY